jgi:hypothetical protein
MAKICLNFLITLNQFYETVFEHRIFRYNNAEYTQAHSVSKPLAHTSLLCHLLTFYLWAVTPAVFRDFNFKQRLWLRAELIRQNVKI